MSKQFDKTHVVSLSSYKNISDFFKNINTSSNICMMYLVIQS